MTSIYSTVSVLTKHAQSREFASCVTLEDIIKLFKVSKVAVLQIFNCTLQGFERSQYLRNTVTFPRNLCPSPPRLDGVATGHKILSLSCHPTHRGSTGSPNGWVFGRIRALACAYKPRPPEETKPKHRKMHTCSSLPAAAPLSTAGQSLLQLVRVAISAGMRTFPSSR